MTVWLAAGLHALAAEPIRDVPLYAVVEESLSLAHPGLHPFRDIDLDLTVRAPTGRSPAPEFSFFGFHDGDGAGGQVGDVWRFRILADTPGTWEVTATFRRAEGGDSLGEPRRFLYRVGDQQTSVGSGHVRRDPAQPRRFALADGTPWVPFPIHSSFLLDQTRETAARWIREHAALGVNALSVRFHAEARNALGVPGNWHFLGLDGNRVEVWPQDSKADGFDYASPDLASWHHNEAILGLAEQAGLRLNIWFGISGDNRQYRSYGPQDWIRDGELGPLQRRFIRYFLARWAALPVWWHWTVDSEYEEGPGDDLARDRAWAAELQRLNPWPTLITTHVLRTWTPGPAPEYDLATLQLRVPSDPARVVADSIDFVRLAEVQGLPVYNAEGVWMLPATASRLGTLAHYFAGGFSHVAHDGPNHRISSWGCEWDSVNPRHREDAAMLGRVARFINHKDFHRFNQAVPAPERISLAGGRHALCLAAPGVGYAVWLDEGGQATLSLEDDPRPYSVSRLPGTLDEAPARLDSVRGGGPVVLEAIGSGYGSDTLFILTAEPETGLHLVYPTQGVELMPGGSVRLRWLASPEIAVVRVEILAEAAENPRWRSLTPEIRNTGEAFVGLPGTLPLGPARIRVIEAVREGAAVAECRAELTVDGDRRPPLLAVAQPAAGSTSGPQVSVSGTASDPSGVSRVEFRKLGDTEWQTARGTRHWTVSLADLPSGESSIEVRATDQSAPEQTSEPTLVRWEVDARAPSILDPEAVRDGDRWFVRWRTDEPASSRIQWGSAPGLFEGDSGVVAEDLTEHRVALPRGAAGDAATHWFIITGDRFGNTATRSGMRPATEPSR